ncbi:unnamed protein product [Angiostrongylus costaricensis]|uniref:Uncharacterized protein n=1 Tax=Angiostrongylus costaricensis TaxID=334426 RepID=A0A0R3PYW3_ANGCS|nr:unnamed protein product [Angiostrongylus costaricensis]
MCPVAKNSLINLNMNASDISITEDDVFCLSNRTST